MDNNENINVTEENQQEYSDYDRSYDSGYDDQRPSVRNDDEISCSSSSNDSEGKVGLAEAVVGGGFLFGIGAGIYFLIKIGKKIYYKVSGKPDPNTKDQEDDEDEEEERPRRKKSTKKKVSKRSSVSKKKAKKKPEFDDYDDYDDDDDDEDYDPEEDEEESESK